MDDQLTKKKLLVVGDSFMRPDPDYPGQHWSEMLSEYDVIMNSQSGASNGIIAYRFYEGLQQQPDAVVIGFGFPLRIEFRFGDRWTTGADRVNTSSEQQLMYDMYQLHADLEMVQLREFNLARGMLSFLEHRKIPFAWTLNGLFNDISRQEPWTMTILEDYFNHRTQTNLATYPNFKMSPGFHTDDPGWQQRFAQEVRDILKTY